METASTLAAGGSDAATEPLHLLHRAPSARSTSLLCPNVELMYDDTATQLVDLIKGYQQGKLAESSAELVRKAYAVAHEAHGEQKRASGEPYIEHPVAVAHILLGLELDPASVAAALLHDVIEDTAITHEQIEEFFGCEVVHLVDGVTKLTVLENQTKEEAQAGTYRKMFIAMADDPRVVLVKLADRLHNMRTISAMRQESQQRNARETLDIYAPLAHRLGIWQIKWELEDRSFALLHPDKYREISRALSLRRDAREKMVHRVISRLNHVLEKEQIVADITGRPKHIYSIYRKMERKNVSLDQIYDQLAVRVIVDTVGECYQILGIVHATWPPVPGEFDDYIAMPKESMYRSLHTTVLIPGGQPCEIQIRTREMHEVSEHGIAAHWRYKEGFARTDVSFEAKLAWLRGLIEWRRDLTDAQEFVDSLKSDVFEEQVYVFTPKGKIIDLPIGSTPVDFAYRIHSEVGHSCVGAKVNNRMIPLDYQLQSGEIIQIMTSKTPRGPSRDWLNFAQTSGARNQIRRYFKRLRREENESAGRDLLEKELKRLGLSPSFDEIARVWGARTIEDVFALIGSGETTARQVAQKMLAQQVQEEETLADIPQIAPQVERKTDSAGIQVRGVEGVLTRLARCCNPVVGEPIVGYITRGRGVTVHRADCRSVLNERDRARLIEVSWGSAQPQQGFSVPMRVEAWDRVGLWRDITNAIADDSINIEAVEQVSTRKPSRAILMVTISVHSIAQLSKILDKLNRLPDIIDARREQNSAPVSA
ncbi:MAG: bifunctional (p)ppGpp synthetase/guanosine-3*,5*-bis(diphosphate) 3*-pyrophosphohydrolase [Chloroflexi bacterium AL-W]|nr:bifunctional (p)ppGpp synthetase/guanosine-3*,5*-bis(diphosphate) 3*-pyrophosphohydrolase [Chloroflexi bacterium AL-N1]NOK70378.1 bifunctional (p)ppGpp synthetase/guanosine-3*,5*-bis(diphosphate) 3*-pyrophosphohydrolase [Chloroflexi bacterium AL-N10]NOK78056.1 bifunctional (p)ppGpp synthetase/guanosine-3*,5*-bis(diphosphate) 3*-pyrophosphohydrolase [Chloroflexi bacterium AL-N5]NOK85155.1 bifunctional (p)ppGpp synthetase/guanosine-3*,5*-bis(diphosphate) 3*-pyrophosphohydrolase [Chloroflexi bac